MATGKDLRKTLKKPSEPASPRPNSSIQQSQQTVRVSSGPLPSPELLGLYESVSPGLANEIIESFKAEYRQRHDMEKIAMNGDVEAMRLQNAQVTRGQWLGFVIAIFGLSAGAVLIVLGHDGAGATLGAVGLASVLAAYFRGNEPSKSTASNGEDKDKK